MNRGRPDRRTEDPEASSAGNNSFRNGARNSCDRSAVGERGLSEPDLVRDTVGADPAIGPRSARGLFVRLKDWRRTATRYDRCGELFFSAVCIAATVLFRLRVLT